MSSLSEVLAGRVALRSVSHLSNDRSAPNVSQDHAQADRDQDAHETYYLDLGMDRWLAPVKDLTFETALIPLSMADAQLLRDSYSHLHGRTYYEDMSKPTSDSLPPNLLIALQDLGERLWPTMRALGAGEIGVFGKLSGRSAKDAPLFTTRLDEGFVQQLTARTGLLDAGGNDDKDNVRLISLFEASLQLMCLNDPASLIWMLINSQRVDEDLDVALRHPERWDQAIVVRRWSAAVSSDLEFRMFVVDGQPTGLTQYNQLIYSPRVAKHADAIATELFNFYQAEMLPRLTGTEFYETVKGRFTCDFAIHPKALTILDNATPGAAAPTLTREHIELVELNCFYEATGMGLFDFHKDKQQLDKGPFESRVRMGPVPHADVKLEVEWRDVLKSLGGETWKSGADTKMRRTTDAAWRQLEGIFSV